MDIEYGIDESRGDYYAFISETFYEFKIITEAREIVEGKSVVSATPEHLRVLLNWVDRLFPQEMGSMNEQPF